MFVFGSSCPDHFFDALAKPRGRRPEPQIHKFFILCSGQLLLPFSRWRHDQINREMTVAFDAKDYLVAPMSQAAVVDALLLKHASIKGAALLLHCWLSVER